MAADGPRTRTTADQALRLSVLAEVATLYYVDRLSQEQISKQIGRSVSMVSRMLAAAEKAGIVEVRVRQPTPVDGDLQTALASAFGLRVARVLQTTSENSSRLLGGLGELSARYLQTILRDDSTVTIGWGTTLYELVQSVAPATYRNLQVVQSLGSLGSNLPQIDNHLITRMLAERLGATPHFISAPMIVDNEIARAALLQDPQIRQTLELGKASDIALIGIGVPDPESAGMLRAGYIDAGTLSSIRDEGAVGDIVVDFFDIHGRLRSVAVSDQVIGIRVADLQAVPTVIAIAGGPHKAAAVLGAVRTGLIHVLVTDDFTARRMLELAREFPVEREGAK